MSKIEKDSFKYLGHEYQMRLTTQILTDRKFANSIVDIIDPNYFEDPQLKIIIATIKDAKKEDDVIPDFGGIGIRLSERINDEVDRRYVLKVLDNLKETTLNDTHKVQDIAMRFCKQQELKKSIKEIQRIIDKGNLEDYEKCENILRKALEHGDNKDDGIDVFDDIKSVLRDDFRNPIRTGINGLDEYMDGGISKGELGVVLAALGVGKSTIITKMANTAVSDGYNVVQIFFEDSPKIIQRKHLACWSGYEINDLPKHDQEIQSMCDEMSKNNKGKLILKKFPSDSTTMPIIKTYLRKLIAKGFKPDIIFIDYIDCVQPSRQYDDANVGEATVMRQCETMISELDLACFVAIQTNRSAIKSELVDTDQMGGSIKKAQIGHFILSIARPMEKKDTKKANAVILKSRFGRDGIVFEDILFDNARVEIDFTDNNAGKTRTEHKKDKDISDQERIRTLMELKNNKNNLVNI